MATGRVTVLGCGSSGGVPLVTGYWGACDPANPKNRRRRASIAVQGGDTTLVVDTGPDFHEQTLINGITKIDAVLYTHGHSDHVNGIDELRYLKFVQKTMCDAWGDFDTLSELQARFPYMFAPTADGLYQPVITPHAFADADYGQTQTIAGLPVIPLWQMHGKAGHSLAYRFGNFAYSTDVSAQRPETLAALAGIDTWLVDCAQYGTDYTIVHPNFPIVQGWNETVRARRVILTHLTPRLDYDALMAELPPGYELAHDGMTLDIAF
ncbi:MAG: MBL fold metallo-hydrolase [Rhodospirillales bacterium]|nr:MBL fold metallo-hydrolase [Alphaproteobacteria bacterium]MCB9987605.1 MBL fold metallo-hydrolase [Rhodospirillales bacterium]USO07680.1 MAG: MBL fold metallo-hydrolase [Rhodospirillales bacterium]